MHTNAMITPLPKLTQLLIAYGFKQSPLSKRGALANTGGRNYLAPKIISIARIQARDHFAVQPSKAVRQDRTTGNRPSRLEPREFVAVTPRPYSERPRQFELRLAN